MVVGACLWTLACLALGFLAGSSLVRRLPLARAVGLATTPEEVFQAVGVLSSDPPASEPENRPLGPSPVGFRNERGEKYLIAWSANPEWAAAVPEDKRIGGADDDFCAE